MLKSTLFLFFGILTCTHADIANHINIQWPFYIPPYPVSPIVFCSQNDLKIESSIKESQSSWDSKFSTSQVKEVQTEQPDQLCEKIPDNYDTELEAIHSWLLDLAQSQHEQRMFPQQQMLHRYLTQVVFDFADVWSDFRMEIQYATRRTIETFRRQAALFMTRKNINKNYLGTLGQLFEHMKALDEVWEENMRMKIDQLFK